MPNFVAASIGISVDGTRVLYRRWSPDARPVRAQVDVNGKKPGSVFSTSRAGKAGKDKLQQKKGAGKNCVPNPWMVKLFARVVATLGGRPFIQNSAVR